MGGKRRYLYVLLPFYAYQRASIIIITSYHFRDRIDLTWMVLKARNTWFDRTNR